MPSAPPIQSPLQVALRISCTRYRMEILMQHSTISLLSLTLIQTALRRPWRSCRVLAATAWWSIHHGAVSSTTIVTLRLFSGSLLRITMLRVMETWTGGSTFSSWFTRMWTIHWSRLRTWSTLRSRQTASKRQFHGQARGLLLARLTNCTTTPLGRQRSTTRMPQACSRPLLKDQAVQFRGTIFRQHFIMGQRKVVMSSAP